jgi:hypothetical protein
MARQRRVSVADEDLPTLERLMRAGMDGARRSKWQIGWPLESLVAPIVIRVVLEVARMHNEVTGDA